MSRELICSVLGIPHDVWPPNHFVLLNLPLEETDPERIERRVIEYMDQLRPYQLAHPEVVTDLMNRLAQALVCLTHPREREAYLATLASPAPAIATPQPNPPALPRERPPESPPHPQAAALPPPSPSSRNAQRRQYRRLAQIRSILRSWDALSEGFRKRRFASPAASINWVIELWQVRSWFESPEGRSMARDLFKNQGIVAFVQDRSPLQQSTRLDAQERDRLLDDWRMGRDWLRTQYREQRALLEGVTERRQRRHRRMLARWGGRVARGWAFWIFALGILSLAYLRGR